MLYCDRQQDAGGRAHLEHRDVAAGVRKREACRDRPSRIRRRRWHGQIRRSSALRTVAGHADAVGGLEEANRRTLRRVLRADDHRRHRRRQPVVRLVLLVAERRLVLLVAERGRRLKVWRILGLRDRRRLLERVHVGRVGPRVAHGPRPRGRRRRTTGLGCHVPSGVEAARDRRRRVLGVDAAGKGQAHQTVQRGRALVRRWVLDFRRSGHGSGQRAVGSVAQTRRRPSGLENGKGTTLHAAGRCSRRREHRAGLASQSAGNATLKHRSAPIARSMEPQL